MIEIPVHSKNGLLPVGTMYMCPEGTYCLYDIYENDETGEYAEVWQSIINEDDCYE